MSVAPTTRAAKVDEIVRLAARPDPEVVPGFHGGFAYRTKGEATTHSPKFFLTRSEATDWLAESNRKHERLFRESLSKETDARIDEMLAFWRNETERLARLRR